MPELPEVEAARRAIERAVNGCVITAARAAPDRLVFDESAPSALARALVGRRVLDVRRRGKYLWWCLDRAPHPVFHLGMSGGFHVGGADAVHLRSSGARDSRTARSVRFTARFDNGTVLRFTDPRRFGRIRLREAPMEEPPISTLGWDPLSDPPALPAFRRALSARSAPVKSVLLDQSVAAGVGNWIADEALYHAGMDPRRAADTLTAPELATLHRVLRRIVHRAVAVDADSTRFPRSWLFHHRWGRRSDARTSDGAAIEHVIIGGRTTAWVPARQR